MTEPIINTIMGPFNIERRENLRRLYQNAAGQERFYEDYNNTSIEWVTQFAQYMLQFLDGESTESTGIFEDASAEEGNNGTLMNQLMKETPLSTRLSVSNTMWLMDALVKLGFMQDRPWREDPEDDSMLLKIHELATAHTNHLLDEVLQWQRDGATLR